VTSYTEDLYKNELLDLEEGYCVSLYTPFYKKKDNENKFNKLLNDTRVHLERCQSSEYDVKKTLDNAKDFFINEFEAKREANSVALFFSKQGYVSRYLQEELPLSTIMVGRRFFIEDLEGYIKENDSYFLVSLFKGQLGFYKISGDEVFEIKLNSFNESFEQLLRDYEGEDVLQYHITGTGASSLNFHGHQSEKRLEEDILRKHVKYIADSVYNFLEQNNYSQPLVISTSPEILGVFREYNRYPNFISENIKTSSLKKLDSKLMLNEEKFEQLISY
jgi:hypothetical protein